MRSVNLQSKQPVSSNSPPASSISPTCELLPMELEGVVSAHKSSSHGILDSQSQSNLPTPYVSAPSSPARTSNPFNATPCFYSYPTSPVVGFSNPSPEFEPSPAAKNISDEEIQQHQKRHVQTMSFADDQFSNGQLRPLKLPPRLQGGSKPSSRVSSPTRSRDATSCCTFYRHSFKNKDLDPFAAALEEIRKEDAWFGQAPPRQLHRRTQSVAPLKSLPWSCGGLEGHEKEIGPAEPAWQVEWVTKRPKEEQNPDLVRLVPIGHSVPNMRPSACSGHPSKAVRRRWSSLVWLSERKLSRDRGIQYESDRWAYAWDKARDQVAKARDQAAMARAKDPSFGERHRAPYKVEEGVQHKRVEMKALTKYKPNKLLLCFGLNSRG
ncbi:hypothetical protein ACLOJK_024823 [Asimina triloba]